MKTIDQIAAEAWATIKRNYGISDTATYIMADGDGAAIIKAAIEKARQQWVYENSLNRAAHASKPWTAEYVAGLMARSPLDNGATQLHKRYQQVAAAHNETLAAHASDLGKTTPKHFDEDGTFHPEEKPAHASERVFEALRDLFALVESGVLVRDISHDADPKWYLKAIELTQVLARAKAALSAHASEADG